MIEYLFYFAAFILTFSAVVIWFLCRAVDYWRNEACQLWKDNDQLLRALLKARSSDSADYWKE